MELRFLALCIRKALGTAADKGGELHGIDIDWDEWLAWVARHKVIGYLHHKLPESTRRELPAVAAGALREGGLLAVRRTLGIAGELSRLAALFEARGIRVMGLKGSLVSQQLYGEPGVRHAGDIDLLVAPGDIAAADSLLRESNYRRSYPDFEPTAFQWRRFLQIEHELCHFHQESGVIVELQWRLEGLPDIAFDELWHSRSHVEIAGRKVAALPAEVAVLFLFAHGAKHGWASLFWLVDAAIYLRGCDSRAASALLDSARRMAVTKPLLQGSLLAREVLGVDLPGELDRSLKESANVRGLVAVAKRRMSRPSSSQDGDLLQNALYLVRLQEGWISRLRLVRRWLLSPSNWREFPLPDRWFWLYYPAGPLLWVWRRFRKRGQAGGENPRQAHPRSR